MCADLDLPRPQAERVAKLLRNHQPSCSVDGCAHGWSVPLAPTVHRRRSGRSPGGVSEKRPFRPPSSPTCDRVRRDPLRSPRDAASLHRSRPPPPIGAPSPRRWPSLAASARRSPPLAVARNPGLRLVALARVCTVTGRWAATIALAVFAYDHGGATALGVLGVVRILPAALAGPLAAVLLDCIGSEPILLGAGLLRTAAIGAAGAAMLDGAHTGLVSRSPQPSQFSPTMVRSAPDRRPSVSRRRRRADVANLSLTTIESAGMLLGPILSGGLLALWNPGGVLVVTAVGYLLSALLIARLPTWRSQEHEGAGGDLLAERVAGLRAISADPRLRMIVGLYCAENVVTGALNILVVIAAAQLLKFGGTGCRRAQRPSSDRGTARRGRRGDARRTQADRIAWPGPRPLRGAARADRRPPVDRAGRRPARGARGRRHDRRLLGPDVGPARSTRTCSRRCSACCRVLRRVDRLRRRARAAARELGRHPRGAAHERCGLAGARSPALASCCACSIGTFDLVSEEFVDLAAIAIFSPARSARARAPGAAARADRRGVRRDGHPRGERGDRYYLVGDGELEVSVAGRNAHSRRGGDGFGEIALVRDAPYRDRTRLSSPALCPRPRALPRCRQRPSPASRNAADAVVELRLRRHARRTRHGLASLETRKTRRTRARGQPCRGRSASVRSKIQVLAPVPGRYRREPRHAVGRPAHSCRRPRALASLWHTDAIPAMARVRVSTTVRRGAARPSERAHASGPSGFGADR